MEVKKSSISRNARAIMCLIGSSMVLICSGGAIYGASSMSVVPAAERFGVSTAATSQYYSFFLVGLIVAAVVGSKILTRFNLHGSATIGGLLGGIGLLLMGFSSSLWMFYLGGFFTGFTIGFSGPALLQTAISKWYYKGRATLIGVVGITEAFGTTAISTLTAYLVESGGSAGFSRALLASAVICIVGNAIGGWIFLRGVPEDYGWAAIGAEDLVVNEGAVEVPGLARNEMFKMPPFWMWLVACAILNMAYGFVNPTLSARVQFIGFSATQAAVVISVWSWSKGISKVVYGLLGDRFGLRVGLSIATLFSIITGIVYINVQSFPMLILCAIGIGVIGGLTGSGTLGLSRMVGSKELTKVALLPHGFNAGGNLLGTVFAGLLATGDAAGYARSSTVSVVVLVAYIAIVWIAMNPKNLFENKKAL